MHWGYGGMGWMMTWWSVFWVAIIVAVIWVMAKGLGRGTVGHEDSPETILKQRYARGDINREEYDQRLRDLRK